MGDHWVLSSAFYSASMTDECKVNLNRLSENLHLMLKDLYQERIFADLVSEDQTLFQAHKIVLSACSPVFKKIIENNPTQYPLIYLRGIQSHEVDSILQLMYLGEATVYQVKIEEFIKVAKDLEVNYVKSSRIIESDTPNTKDSNYDAETKNNKAIYMPTVAKANHEIIRQYTRTVLIYFDWLMN